MVAQSSKALEEFKAIFAGEGIHKKVIRPLAAKYARRFRLEREDLEQDAVVLLLQQCRSFDPDKGKPEQWAYRLVENLFKSIVQKQCQERAQKQPLCDVCETEGSSDIGQFLGQILSPCALAALYKSLRFFNDRSSLLNSVGEIVPRKSEQRHVLWEIRRAWKALTIYL